MCISSDYKYPLAFVLFLGLFGGLMAYMSNPLIRKDDMPEIRAPVTTNHYTVTALWNDEYQPALVRKLLEAKERIRVVMYQVSPRNNPVKEILDALAAATERGVDVQVILSRGTFGNHKLERDNEAAVDYLTSRGVRARINRVPMETHAKLVIIDDRTVILGAHNWSMGALEINNELSLMIESDRPDPRPAAYFEQVNRVGGGASQSRGTQSDMVVYLGNYEYYAVLKGALDRAKDEIRVVLYLMRAEGGGYAAELINRILKRTKAGVAASVVLDDDAVDINKKPVNRQAIDTLRAKGINAVFDGTPKATHVKLVVIDRETVVVGSQNWTNSALGGGNFEFGVLVRSRKLAEDVLNGLRQRIGHPSHPSYVDGHLN